LDYNQQIEFIKNLVGIIQKVLLVLIPVLLIALYFVILNKFKYRCTVCKTVFKITELKLGEDIFLGKFKYRCPHCSKITTFESIKSHKPN
jgi:predicted SprT family Zn-dependent metalloprotease